MGTLILSINAGSSSLKTSIYQLPDGAKQDESDKLRRLASAEISNISSPPSKVKYTRGAHSETQDLQDIHDHTKAFEHVLQTYLADEQVPEARSRDDIKYACHRVVHGGDFTGNELITKQTFDKIESFSDLAPLHNASAVALMKACHEHMPDVTNVACFDSAFHQTMPAHVKTYMIDQSVAREKGLRKYGFHGLSYAYITRAVASFLDKPVSQTNLIALHLGSGASACAIRHGQSLDTSMGLTPVSGLPGGTRSGDIDPSLIFHYTSHASRLSSSSSSSSSTAQLHISQAEEILNKKSGWKAVAGTADFADIAASSASSASSAGDDDGANGAGPAAKRLALDIFTDRIVGYVGSYYVKLGGEVDALVFAGGIGEKSAELRKLVTDKVSCLGFGVDGEKNRTPPAADSSTAGEDGGGGGGGGGSGVVDITATATTTTSSTGHGHDDHSHSHSNSEKKKMTKRVLICQTDEDYEMAYSTAASMSHSN